MVQRRNIAYQFSVLIACLLLGMCEILYPSISWTPTNPIFSENRTQCVYPMSKIIFVCPNPGMVVGIQKDGTAKERMHENLWQVDRLSYEQCKVNRSHPQTRQLLRCEAPLELRYSLVVFNEFSAKEGGPEYLPGEEYYFIATSDGTKASLDSESAGHCMTANMRMTFRVCANSSDVRCESPDRCHAREISVGTTPVTTTQAHRPPVAPTASNSTTQAAQNTTRDTPRPPGTPPGRDVTGLHAAIGVLAVLSAGLLMIVVYLLRRDWHGNTDRGGKAKQNPKSTNV